MVNFVSLVALGVFVLGVPVKGDLFTLTVGALLYVMAATGFGMLISTVVRTQIAAIFAVAILTILPAVNFSGLLTPVSSLAPVARSEERRVGKESGRRCGPGCDTQKSEGLE